jgi:Putative auto-transporter adhesin, head GIN domain
MKRLIAPALLVLALAGPAAADMRSVARFHAVEAEDRLTVTLAIGDGYAVEVTGSDANRIRTRVRNGTLHIEDEHRPWFGRTPRLDAQVRITAPAIDSVSAARGVEFSVNLSGGPCDDFSAVAAMGGSANITGVQCNAVSSTAAMGGDVRIAGTCRSHDVTAAMGAFVRADELACETVDATASMGGEVRAFASQSYEASASMGGDISVTGGARSRETTASMGGSVHADRQR